MVVTTIAVRSNSQRRTDLSPGKFIEFPGTMRENQASQSTVCHVQGEGSAALPLSKAFPLTLGMKAQIGVELNFTDSTPTMFLRPGLNRIRLAQLAGDARWHVMKTRRYKQRRTLWIGPNEWPC